MEISGRETTPQPVSSTTDFFHGRHDEEEVKLATLPDIYPQVVLYILVVILIFSFIGNLLAITSLSLNKKVVYPWFFNLSLADLIKTMFCMPYSIYLVSTGIFMDNSDFDNANFSCQCFGFIFHLTLLLGLVSNMCVAMDRVYATYFPFHYSNNQNKISLPWLITVVWVLTGLAAGLPFYLQISFGENARSPFYLREMIPMCIFDFREANQFREVDAEVVDHWCYAYYFCLYCCPVIIIVTSSCLVMKRLLPKLLKGNGIRVKKKIVVITNSAVTDGEGGLTDIGDDNLTTGFNTNRSPRFAGSSPVVTPLSTTVLSTTTVKDKLRKKSRVLDGLLSLHISKKHSSRKHAKRNQWRAIQTMVIVSISFVLCHVTHILYWLFYDELFYELYYHAATDGTSMSRYIALQALMTGQIVIVYLDSAINVIVYYSRCTLIKEMMKDRARAFLSFSLKPVLYLIRHSNTGC